MIPFALMTADGRSRSLNAQRLINLFPEQPSIGAKSELILRGTPGLSTFATIGAGPIRGVHVMDGVLFIVTGTDLYSVDSAGAGTLRGSAGTIAGTGFVSMASNANGELVITNSAGTGWLWDGATLATVVSHDADFTDDATNVTFLDQYILYGKQGTGQAFASDLNNAKSWNALSFDTAESSPDNIVEVFAAGGVLWLFGETTTEVYYNAGTSPFAFARIGGAVLEDIGGTLGTAAKVDQSVYWRGSDGIVYRATGLQPQRISTHDIENRIRDWTNFYSFTYKDEGHGFYVLGADQGSVVYDAALLPPIGWHERDTFTVGRWRGNSYASAYGKHLVGDYLIGRIYEMSLDNSADGATALQRLAVSQPIHADGDWMTIPHIQVHFEHGVGLTSGQGSDPQVMMDWSNDGGFTYGNERLAAIGKIGERRKRAVWRRTGRFRERVFRLKYTEPTAFTIYGANQ